MPHAVFADCRLGLCLCLVLSQCAGKPASAEGNHPPVVIQPERLESILHRARERNRQYRAPTMDDLLNVEATGRALLSKVVHSPPCEPQSAAAFDLATRLPAKFDLGARFKESHFDLLPTQLGGASAVALREDPLHRRGSGVYIFRLGAVPRERLVQVPHSFYDLGTLEIGRELAYAAHARALFVNTVHRYQGAKFSIGDEEDQGEAPADLAHQGLTFFQSLTLAALTTIPQLQVVQVHGFADGAVPECAQAAVVVSAGAAPAGEAEAARVAWRLAAVLGANRVLLYPRDTRKLGARTNQQGRAVAASPFATFLHLELSRSLRDELLLDAGLRRAFVAAIITPSGEIP